MFDMGFQEIVLIGVIALIVIGPERLPSVARSIGLWVGKMQRFVAGVKSDIASELQTDELRSMLNSQEDQIRELKDMVKEAQTGLERTASETKASVTEGMESAVGQVKDAADTAKENAAKMREIASGAGYATYDDDPPVKGTDSGSTDSGAADNTETVRDDDPKIQDQDSSKSA